MDINNNKYITVLNTFLNYGLILKYIVFIIKLINILSCPKSVYSLTIFLYRILSAIHGRIYLAVAGSNQTADLAANLQILNFLIKKKNSISQIFLQALSSA
jgi:hypothetical protein